MPSFQRLAESTFGDDAGAIDDLGRPSEMAHALLGRAIERGRVRSLITAVAVATSRPVDVVFHEIMAEGIEASIEPPAERADFQIDGRQRRLLRDALLAAFPSGYELRQFVDFKLDKSLAVISPDSNLREMAFNLVVWAKSTGRLRDLVDAVRKARPGNTAVQTLSAKLDVPVPPRLPASVHGENPALTPAEMRQLTDAFCYAFPTIQNLVELANFELDLNLYAISAARSHARSVSREGGARDDVSFPARRESGQHSGWRQPQRDHAQPDPMGRVTRPAR